jgi:H+/Na+-translocating ferredoxin:NAD+ oxidoreductase subunit C
MLKFTPKRRLTGGMRLPAHKTESTAKPIRRGFIPSRLVVSTRQHRGPAASPVVEIGQNVLRGEPIARGDSIEAADVHAPTSGRVVAIEPREVPLSSAMAEEICIVIETDGEDRPAKLAPVDPAARIEDRLRQIASAGIVGLGGAIYPTAAKLELAPEIECELLIINGAECEPYISCDDMLMREAAQAILDGAEILREIVKAKRCIVAIERDKPQAIDAITAAAEALAIEGLTIAELPTIYPAGGERQLVDVLTGVEVPNGRFPGDEGIVCQNVGTAYATHRYFRHGEPLTSRIVTVTGSAVGEPCNIEAMIGTPIADLIAASGGYRGEAVQLIQGGSMMGFAMSSDSPPVTKASNCIIAAARHEVRLDAHEWPCIRCGECSIVCPARLQPQDLVLAARASNAGVLAELQLSECIECGLCDIVCPSHILLTQAFRDAKQLMKAVDAREAFSRESDERFQQRERRRQEALAEEDRRRDEIRRTLSHEEARAEEIRAAVARARQRRTEADGH